MKQPKSKLPWQLDELDTYMHILINDVDGNLVLDVVSMQLDDHEYIVQACNNFPKAIELLKSLAPLPDSEVYNFLKQLENESKDKKVIS